MSYERIEKVEKARLGPFFFYFFFFKVTLERKKLCTKREENLLLVCNSALVSKNIFALYFIILDNVSRFSHLS